MNVSKLFGDGDDSFFNLKSPLSYLNEICIQYNFKLEKKTASVKDEKNSTPIYMCKITMNDFTSTQYGTSIKRAQHAAALSILKKIQKQSGDSNPIMSVLIDSVNEYSKKYSIRTSASKNDFLQDQSNCSENTTIKHQQSLEDYDSNIISEIGANPIGELNSFCQKYQLNAPQFYCSKDSGPPHNPIFKCICKFGEFKAVGYGASKQLAKRQVCLDILKKLESSPPPSPVKPKKKSNCNKIIDDDEVQINSFHEFYNSKKFYIKKLMDTDLVFDKSVDFIRRLETLAKEQNFNVYYDAVETRTKDGDIEVDVNIDTNPPLFCTGYDFTYDMAKQRAALSIMRFIKRKCSQVENDSVFH